MPLTQQSTSTPACRSSGSTPLDARALKPGDHLGDIAVGINEYKDVGHLKINQLAVVGQQKFVKLPLGQHGAVVVAHVLRDGDKLRHIMLAQLF